MYRYATLHRPESMGRRNQQAHEQRVGCARGPTASHRCGPGRNV